ncbi:MAG: class B sortase [Lachnospiraceae bacterium]|nr:class B sortase [Lachnospiraceae bacterium]
MKKHSHGHVFPILIVVLIILPVVGVAISSKVAGSRADEEITEDVSSEYANEPDEEETTFEEAAEDDLTGEETPVQETTGRESAEEEFISLEEFTDRTGTPGTETTDTEDRPVLEKYKPYLDINPYVAGWLTIDGCGIDDPVVYTPGSQNYYLHRALDGSGSERGTFFIAINWHKGCNNTLIYGHNMSDGSGFGSLSKYSKEDFALAHPVIEFDTLYEEKQYSLLAAFYSQIPEEELETDEDRAEADARIESGETDLTRDFGLEDIFRKEKDEDNGRFRYYYYTDLSSKEDFDYFIRNVDERKLYDTGEEAVFGDELIVMSTCSYQVKNGRFVVVAVHHKD